MLASTFATLPETKNSDAVFGNAIVQSEGCSTLSIFHHDAETIVHLGDSLEVLRLMPSNSVDAIVTDPPYALTDLRGIDIAAITAWATGDRSFIPSGRGFQGAHWDAFVPPPVLWDECYRVLKPGGHLLSFAASRTQDIMSISIRFAGFEIRDSIAWINSSGFPKSLDVAKAIDAHLGAVRPQGDRRPVTEDGKRWSGWGTSLKPSHEPIIAARKPLEESSVAKNVLTHGVGGLNIDATRIGSEEFTESGEAIGKWPTNVVVSHSESCQQVGSIQEQLVRNVTQGWTGFGQEKRPKYTSQKLAVEFETFECSDGCAVAEVSAQSNPSSTEIASRYFPAFTYQKKAGKSERPSSADGMQHISVKPLSLMRWLVRLVTPVGGVVLDPFLGSGTTVEAARLERFRSIGIEREHEYLELIAERLKRTSIT